MSISDLSETEIILVGNGLAAWGVLHELSQKYPDKRIIHLSADEQLPPCAFHSTATVSLNGIVKGHSPLGDLLVDSYHYTEELISQWNSDSIIKTTHYHFGDEAGLERRFGQLKNLDPAFLNQSRQGVAITAYLFDPVSFYNWFQREIISKLVNYQHEKQMVVSVHENKKVLIKCLSGAQYSTNKAIFCTGAWDRAKFDGKAVGGHYLQWDNIEYEDSFLLTLNGHNLIYNKNLKRLLMGGTTNKDEVSLLDHEQLNIMFEDFNTIIKGGIPEIDQSQLTYGLRQKGKRRMPFWGKVSGFEKIYTIHSLYKNGYSLGWELGKKTVRDFLDK